MPAHSSAQVSRSIEQKKQRLSEAERSQRPPGTAGRRQPPTLIPAPAKEPHAELPATPGPQRSVYFSGPQTPLARLGLEFFDQPAVPLAQALPGQVLARWLADGREIRGRIVETEAQLGPQDDAAHSRGGRQTLRDRGMFMKPGTLYVYVIYGMYFCMNISSRGDGACVLLRALELLGGLEAMRQLRGALRGGAAGQALKDRELCSGPSKLCQALAIDKSFDQWDLAQDQAVWLERSPLGSGGQAVVTPARVGIGPAGEWARKPLRFYFQCSPWVSRRAGQDSRARRESLSDAFNCLKSK
ncbi:LOW QUALITY PROTEIN: DNA-3-methyladenine glycosylase-like [Choloepus didactylus]|uniref:LOW QUALITY PROTEIN: DNA-3-methyladenine glycosylase-like n=1 Tax=Choloepus didactylus TaxID=27675 RepID=UPI0018A11459|nr:LOW QUALITY PROTEIN: DNA-3-methyladenine glycosylase-like [Choloepus didactylus]